MIQDEKLETVSSKLVREGWRRVEHEGFAAMVGPFWEKKVRDESCLGFFSEPRHHNRAGLVQGGMLATLADLGLGRTARFADPRRRQATIELNVHYIDSARIGEFIAVRCRKLRETRTLAIFFSCVIEAEGRIIANVSGIWRVVRSHPPLDAQ